LDALLDEISAEHVTITRRLEALQPPEAVEPVPALSEALLERLRARLDAGLALEERQEILQLLVKRIMVHTAIDEVEKKGLRLVIEYRFPATLGVVLTSAGTPVGTAPRRSLRPSSITVHPHACGDSVPRRGQPLPQRGSPPRLWGQQS